MIVIQNRIKYILIEIYTVNWALLSSIPRGLMARIPGFHPGGPGSIPGVGVQSFFIPCLLTKHHVSK